MHCIVSTYTSTVHVDIKVNEKKTYPGVVATTK